MAPKPTPETVRFLISRYSAGIRGRPPLAKPTASTLAHRAVARSAASKTSPPTVSSTTSAPRPDVISRTASRNGRSPRFTVHAAPCAVAKASLAAELAAAMTRAPFRTPISIAARLTPPPAPVTRRVSPA